MLAILLQILCYFSFSTIVNSKVWLLLEVKIKKTTPDNIPVYIFYYYNYCTINKIDPTTNASNITTITILQVHLFITVISNGYVAVDTTIHKGDNSIAFSPTTIYYYYRSYNNNIFVALWLLFLL